MQRSAALSCGALRALTGRPHTAPGAARAGVLQDAIAKMNDADMGGRPIRVSFAERGRPDLPPRVRRSAAGAAG